MMKNFSVKEFYNFFLKFFLILPTFFLPFFVLPFTANLWEINKIYLLGSCTIIVFFLYILKISFSQEFEFKKNFLLFFVFLFILFSFLSNLFSSDKYFSFIGSFGINNNGFLALLFLVIYFFLIFQIFENPKILISFFITGSVISLIVFLFTALAPNSLIQKIPPVLNFLKIKFFNPASPSLPSFAIFLTTLTIFFTVHFFTTEKKWKKFLDLIFLTALLISLFIIQNKIAWLNLLVGLILFMVLSAIFKLFTQKLNYYFLPTILAFISLFFIVFGQTFAFFNFPEITLGQKFSWEIAWKACQSSLKNLLIGTGPATFSYNFLKFKSPKINQAGFGMITLEKGQNYFLNILIEQGIISLILILIIIFSLIVLCLKRKIPAENSKYFFTWLTIVSALFLYPSPYIILFSFWFFLGLTILSFKDIYTIKKVNINQPEQKIVLFFLIGLVLFFILFLFLFGRQYYLGEIFYKKYLTSTEQKDKIINLEKAVNYDKRNSFYHLTLAQEYVNLFFEESKIKDQTETRLVEILNRTISEAEQATILSPNNSFFWQGRGVIYRNLQFFVNGALQKAEESFLMAQPLDPQNPFIYAELIKVYLTKQDFSKAKEYLEKGRATGVNYWELSLLEAKILEGEQNVDQAISLTENLARNYPNNIDILFELGRLYFNNGKIDSAITTWEKLITISPNHINTLYSLALAYEKKGDNQKAISFLEKILQINPNLKEVENYLNRLKSK